MMWHQPLLKPLPLHTIPSQANGRGVPIFAPRNRSLAPVPTQAFRAKEPAFSISVTRPPAGFRDPISLVPNLGPSGTPCAPSAGLSPSPPIQGLADGAPQGTL